MGIRIVIRIVINRVLQAIPLLLGIILINFILINIAPGDPVTLMLGPTPVSEEYIERVRQDLGLDKPFSTRLVTYISNAIRGDLGISYAYRQPVLKIVFSRIPATLLLMGVAYLLSAIIGILLGTISSYRPGSLIDNASMIIALTGYSVPAFWTAFLAILLFSIKLGLFPVGGMVNVRVPSEGVAHIMDVLHHMVLPVLVLTFFFMALTTRLTRGSMLEVLHSDYITLARSKGLSEKRVIFRHALPNAIIPVLTILGLQFGYMLGGAVLTETVFSWPGIGRLMVESVGRRDFPLLMGIFITTSIFAIVANLITDLVYVLINPRIRVQ